MVLFYQNIFAIAPPVVCQKGVYLLNQSSAFTIITASTTVKGLILFLRTESAIVQCPVCLLLQKDRLYHFFVHLKRTQKGSAL